MAGIVASSRTTVAKARISMGAGFAAQCSRSAASMWWSTAVLPVRQVPPQSVAIPATMVRPFTHPLSRAQLPCVRLKPPQIQASVTDELAIEGGVMCGRRLVNIAFDKRRPRTAPLHIGHAASSRSPASRMAHLPMMPREAICHWLIPSSSPRG